MRDAQNNMKTIEPSDDLRGEYNTILDNFPTKTISETLKEIINLRIEDESLSLKLEEAL
jgi:DNA-binding transcriptional regulator WhiA